jgi:hypothetical protein
VANEPPRRTLAVFLLDRVHFLWNTGQSPLVRRSRNFSVKYRNDAGFYKELSAARTLFFGKATGGGPSRASTGW